MSVVREQRPYMARTTGWSEDAGSARRRIDRSAGLAAAVSVGLAAVLLTGCGKEEGASGPKKLAGGAAPAPGDSSKDRSKKASASPSSSRSPGADAEDGKGSPDGSGNNDAGTSGAGGGSGSEGGSGPGAGNAGPCKTSQLAFSTSNGMAEGTLVVNLKNTGTATCTLKGFPGADLKGEGGSLPAARRNAAAPMVSVDSGEATHFTLNYPANDSGGSGVNMTSLVVTPPNETHSQTLPVSINLPVSDSAGPGIAVGPVGAGQ
ncbi:MULTISPECIES: DUF4232 domain-containing protein [unclassified Streptomyces]|uniref:DUF4232 domain-containing protein n=1 Tax=unclassified Streptomyces TaxID=2593676 RepID=UPI002DD82F17|nr:MULTISPECIES: DUF4232 domain-containing protein [unclassified Streptomyces]WSA90983.1 DUF4232 domain-containing protein [Streptomyces sp. NBC_01795]WSB75308.1 DUF4232 domain-containing protein [Streptomyces sp. NBC_01775]WSS16409.1 DUF4232 domain-containing protein [Streptomyces sp. NBC_01186]WSS45227.1 DUF4232 domain-containing protein [Streptomyces sp. NBC_01187]